MAPHSSTLVENPMDGGAWWAAVYGVAQSRTRLKRLSSSSSKGLRKEIVLPTNSGIPKAISEKTRGWMEGPGNN